jgi:hypothetical protein
VPRLVWEHGCVRYQQRLHWRANSQSHASELARRQEVIGIGYSGAGVNCAARAIERIVDEIKRAGRSVSRR